jgi:tRNA(Leu) C34 or U34 (ribose-2'-O)-methylase TrmL
MINNSKNAKQITQPIQPNINAHETMNIWLGEIWRQAQCMQY